MIVVVIENSFSESYNGSEECAHLYSRPALRTNVVSEGWSNLHLYPYLCLSLHGLAHGLCHHDQNHPLNHHGLVDYLAGADSVASLLSFPESHLALSSI